MPILYTGGESPDEIAARARRLAEDLDRFAAGVAPAAADLEGAPLLDLFKQTRRHAPALMGIVRGHPARGDGRVLLTSEIFCMDADAGWARSWSRFYRLGRAAGLAGRGVQ